MTFPVALTTDLHALSAAADDPDVDIAATLAQLEDAAAAGIGSYLGLCVAVADGANAFALSTLPEEGEVIGSSVVIPLTAANPANPGAVTRLVLYAGAPGAFIDVAADLAWMTGRDMSEFGVDEHLTHTPSTPAARSVRALSNINQAVGVLIGRGRTPEQAAHDLALLAAHHDGDLPAAAASILDQLT